MRKNYLLFEFKKFQVRQGVLKCTKLMAAILVFLVLSGHAYSQNYVSGAVSNSAGEAIIGANVLVKGTSRGTITDSKGYFNIIKTGESDTLVISMIGYEI